MADYRVLSLWQPWATLLAHGIKRNETRPKETRWKGVYLIHAAMHFDQNQIDLLFQTPFREALIEIYGVAKFKDIVNNLPFGKIIGAFEVDTCHMISEYQSGTWPNGTKWKVKIDPLFDYSIPYKELMFGDYRAGRYIWFGKHHRVLKDPIPYKGSQGYYSKFTGDESKLVFK